MFIGEILEAIKVMVGIVMLVCYIILKDTISWINGVKLWNE